MLITALVALVIVVLAAGLRAVPENRRVAVFRLGRFHGVAGPGLVFLLPVVDRASPVDLDDLVPEWRALGNDEIAVRVRLAMTP